MNFLISGTGRDGGTEWRRCDLSADGKIVFIHTATKSVYLMRSQFLRSFCMYVYCVTCSERYRMNCKCIIHSTSTALVH
jgi:hypothetical protein